MKNFKKLSKVDDVERFQLGDLEISLVSVTEGSQNYLLEVALSMNEDEPCRICGELIKDAKAVVWAGYSDDNKSRSAHKSCWDADISKSKRAYPKDEQNFTTSQ